MAVSKHRHHPTPPPPHSVGVVATTSQSSYYSAPVPVAAESDKGHVSQPPFYSSTILDDISLSLPPISSPSLSSSSSSSSSPLTSFASPSTSPTTNYYDIPSPVTTSSLVSAMANASLSSSSTTTGAAAVASSSSSSHQLHPQKSDSEDIGVGVATCKVRAQKSPSYSSILRTNCSSLSSSRVKYWIQGICNRGSSCRFVHAVTTETTKYLSASSLTSNSCAPVSGESPPLKNADSFIPSPLSVAVNTSSPPLASVQLVQPRHAQSLNHRHHLYHPVGDSVNYFPKLEAIKNNQVPPIYSSGNYESINDTLFSPTVNNNNHNSPFYNHTSPLISSPLVSSMVTAADCWNNSPSSVANSPSVIPCAASLSPHSSWGGHIGATAFSSSSPPLLPSSPLDNTFPADSSSSQLRMNHHHYHSQPLQSQVARLSTPPVSLAATPNAALLDHYDAAATTVASPIGSPLLSPLLERTTSPCAFSAPPFLSNTILQVKQHQQEQAMIQQYNDQQRQTVRQHQYHHHHRRTQSATSSSATISSQQLVDHLEELRLQSSTTSPSPLSLSPPPPSLLLKDIGKYGLLIPSPERIRSQQQHQYLQQQQQQPQFQQQKRNQHQEFNIQHFSPPRAPPTSPVNDELDYHLHHHNPQSNHQYTHSSSHHLQSPIQEEHQVHHQPHLHQHVGNPVLMRAGFRG